MSQYLSDEGVKFLLAGTRTLAAYDVHGLTRHVSLRLHMREHAQDVVE